MDTGGGVALAGADSSCAVACVTGVEVCTAFFLSSSARLILAVSQPSNACSSTVGRLRGPLFDSLPDFVEVRAVRNAVRLERYLA